MVDIAGGRCRLARSPGRSFRARWNDFPADDTGSFGCGASRRVASRRGPSRVEYKYKVQSRHDGEEPPPTTTTKTTTTTTTRTTSTTATTTTTTSTRMNANERNRWLLGVERNGTERIRAT
ncbi:hypothetical protein WN48_09143 [Eufriesea mexicana]|nr:hypothetical protein WN48_09143 [Eufriesea mexicana]